MKVEYYKEYSHELGRDMEFKVYGHAGRPCLVFPAQAGKFFDFENFKIVEAISDFIEAGRIQLFCIDSLDGETFCAQGDPRGRMEHHERWVRYICNEMVGRIKEINGYVYDRIMTTGCSMGAYHAVTFLLRRPDLFDKCLAMSGIYEVDSFLPGYHDDLTYENSPAQFITNLSFDHPYMDMYESCEIVICVGKGKWEEECIASTQRMQKAFESRGIEAWIDYWGYDVDHDWPWWRKQMPYFLQFMC